MGIINNIKFQHMDKVDRIIYQFKITTYPYIKLSLD